MNTFIVVLFVFTAIICLTGIALTLILISPFLLIVFVFCLTLAKIGEWFEDQCL